ncbi:MAG: biotin transporter BioY [Lachnospiraceae bacterium]
MKNKIFTTKELILIAMFAALTAVTSQISIPLPFTPIPINLATLSVFLAGGLLGSKNGATSQIIYVLLGAVGLPVFAGFTGGLGRIVGPTGGYIIGYVVAALVIGQLLSRLPKNIWSNVISMIGGLSCCYILGTAWFMLLTKTGMMESLTLCVVPFLLGDFLKIILAAFLVRRLETVVTL